MKLIYSRIKLTQLTFSRIGLGLLTFLMVIGAQSPLLSITVAPVTETNKNPVYTVVSNYGETRSQKPSLFSEIEQGKNLYQAGRLADALSLWQQAAQEFDREGDRPNQSLSLNYMALAYHNLGQLDQAQEAIARSQKILAEIGEIHPEVLNTQGSLQLTMGQPEAALETWKQAERAYAETDDEIGRLGSLINQAGAMQALGQYHRARIVLEQVKADLDLQPDSSVKMTGLHSLGIALQVVGDLTQSQEVLKQSLQISQQLAANGNGNLDEMSGILVSLGNTAKALIENDAALDYYQQATARSNSPIAQLEAQLNQLNLLIDLKQWTSARALLPEIESNLSHVSPSRMSVYARTNFAKSLMNLEAQTNSKPANNSQGLLQVSQLLAKAVKEARELPDSRAESFALGQLASLYEQTQQWPEARSLTEQALIIAQSIHATDIIPRWQWQLGRVLLEQGDIPGAIAAYSEAVNALQSLRGDLTAIASDVQFSFRESAEPIYRQLVDLLLKPTEGQVSQENLQQARQTIELLQLAELDNFFRNACLTPEPAEIDRIDPTAATIYPIILPDRLAIVLSLPGLPLKYYETPIPEQQVISTIKETLKFLNPNFSNRKRLQFSQQLYDWLIRPAAMDLQNSGVETLVFVMDGWLRNLPASVLYDGQQYLIEKYNIALTPGLQLLEPRAIAPEKFAVLTAGLSVARQNFSALPGVEFELNEIAAQVPSKIFFNREFTESNLHKHIEAIDFPVVHLATHAQFSSNPEETFILTWDGKIQVEDFHRLLTRRDRENSSPVELIVLSACQTAQGDDRAALGLAGIAVRSGARSTIASLWSVDDNSTAQLMTEFYRQLATSSGMNKAQALRQAQLSLLQGTQQHQHPFYWAPFVLIGNWL